MPVSIADSAGLRIGGDGGAGGAAVGPVGGHLLKIGDQQVGRGLQIGGAAVAVAAGAAVALQDSRCRAALPAPGPVPFRSWPQSRNSIA